MKVFVVLVLAVLTGCNAYPRAARQRSKLEMMAEPVLGIGVVHAQAANRIYTDFEKTKFGSDVVTSLINVINDAGEFVDAASKALFPATTAMIETTFRAGLRLVAPVSQYIVKNLLEPMAERAAPVMEEALGQLVLRGELVQDLVSPYITELREKVDPYLQDIQARIHALDKSSVNTQ